jgi:hypothetical protein
MSFKLGIWTLGLLVSAPALAHSGTQHIDLPNCGGHAMVYRNERQTIIKIEDVTDCSNVSVNGQRIKMQNLNDRYSYVYTWQPTFYREQLTLRVHSNTSRTEDYVQLQADENYAGKKRPRWERPSWKPHYPAPAPVVTVRDDELIYLDEARNTALLPSCGGRVRVDIEQQKLIVRLEGANTCDRVRLTVFNQQPLAMESVRRLDRNSEVWTFRLPERAVRPGRNSLTLAIENRYRERADFVRYYFSDQRWFFASGGR